MNEKGWIAGRARVLSLVVAAGWPFAAWDARASELYSLDFQSSPLRTVPEDFFVLKGEFSIQENEGQRFMELPGQPLDTFVALFGPSLKSNVEVTLKVFGQSNGRLTPSFGVGLNGAGGVRFMVQGGRRHLELTMEGRTIRSAEYSMSPNAWTHLKFRRLQLDSGCRYSGKAWTEGAPEPKEWMIAFDAEEIPFPGQSSLIGVPYSGKPIWFDDLKITELKAE
jgi:hypothetical protein